MSKASELAKLKLVLRDAGFYESDGEWKQMVHKTREDGVAEGRREGRREVAELALTVWGLRDRYPDTSEEVTDIDWGGGKYWVPTPVKRTIVTPGSRQFLIDLEAAATLTDAEAARERIFGVRDE